MVVALVVKLCESSPESSQGGVKLQNVCLVQRSCKVCGPPEARIWRGIYANQHPNRALLLPRHGFFLSLPWCCKRAEHIVALTSGLLGYGSKRRKSHPESLHEVGM